MFREILVFVPQVQFRQDGPGVRERPEVRGEGNTREALGEIVGETLAVVRRMQDAVDVIEDGVLGDGSVAVFDPEPSQGRVRDVVDALQLPLQREEVRVVRDTPWRGVDPPWEALSEREEVEVGHSVGDEGGEWFGGPDTGDADRSVRAR